MYYTRVGQQIVFLEARAVPRARLSTSRGGENRMINIQHNLRISDDNTIYYDITIIIAARVVVSAHPSDVRKTKSVVGIKRV